MLLIRRIPISISKLTVTYCMIKNIAAVFTCLLFLAHILKLFKIFLCHNLLTLKKKKKGLDVPLMGEFASVSDVAALGKCSNKVYRCCASLQRPIVPSFLFCTPCRAYNNMQIRRTKKCLHNRFASFFMIFCFILFKVNRYYFSNERLNSFMKHISLVQKVAFNYK